MPIKRLRIFRFSEKVKVFNMSMDGIGKNKIDLNLLKAGFELKHIAGDSKMESIFRALDGDSNGVLDAEELNKFFQLADSDDVDGVLTAKEAKAFVKGNADLKDAKVKKEELLAFLEKMQENSENIDTVETLTINDEKVIVIKYKDIGIKQKTFYQNGDYETISENEAESTITELRNNDDVLLKKSISNGENTETTEYEADGSTVAKLTTEEGPNKKTVTNYENGIPVTRVVTENNVETIYQYNPETQTFEKTREIANKGHDALEQTTVYNPALGVRTEVRNEGGAEITTTYLEDEFISRTSKAGNYTEETKYDNTKQHGFITNRTYKNGDNYVCYSNTEDLNTRTYERREIGGKVYEANYDGNGNTYVVVQYGETFKEFCEHMGVSPQAVKELNKENPKFNSGKQGATVLVPGYIEPNSNKFINRKSAEEVKELVNREYTQKREIRDKENSKTEMTITLEDVKYKDNYEWYKKTFPHDMDWKWVARWLYTQEGAQKINDYQVEQRAAILKQLNPGINDGEIYGKPIKVKYDTSELELKEASRKPRPVTYPANSRIKTYRDLAIDLWRKEHGGKVYIDYLNRFEVAYREKVLREMNPNVPDGQLAGKTLNVTVADSSGLYQDYTKKMLDKDVGGPTVRALLTNKGEHSQAKLNALSKITTKEEFESYVRCAEGQKEYGYYKMPKWLYIVPEQDRDTFVQKWYKQGILEDSDLINLQSNKAYWAIRDACDGLNVFSNSEEIRQAVKLITDPTGQNNPEYARKVYQDVNSRIILATRRENIWSGKTFNLEEYINDEWWVFQSDRDNYELNLTAQGAKEIHGTPRAGETQEQADSRERVNLAAKTFKSATIGAGTNEHSMEDVLMFLNDKNEFNAFKDAIKDDYSWNGYKDVVQYALYDELSLDEIGRINENLISKGFYDKAEADEIRAFYKVQVLKDGDQNKIKNAFRTVSSKAEFDLIDKQLNGGFVNFVKTNPGFNINSDMILASAGKYLSKNDQIDVAYNLLSGQSVLFLNEDVVSAALNCIQSEEVAQAVDAKLRRKNTSIDKLRRKYCHDKDTRVTDRPLMEATTPAKLSQAQIKQNKAAVKVFEEQLADFEAQYNAVKDREGALSEFINGFYETLGVSITTSDIEELIAYDKETLQYLKLAAEGRLDQYRNGQRENISLEDVIKLRASNVRQLSAAKSIKRTTNESKVGATPAEIQQMSKDMDLLSYENDCRASLLTCWKYLSKVDSGTSKKELASAIEDTISNLNSFTKSEGKEFSLPPKYFLVDGVIKNRDTNQDATTDELMHLVFNLKKGLSDITKGVLGVEIPTNATYGMAKDVFDDTFKAKKKSVTATYEKAYGRVMSDSILEKHTTNIGYGKMVVQVVGTLVVAVGTSVVTEGSGIAMFLSTAATSMTLGSIDQVTSANGITHAEGNEVISGALWDGLLTMSGFKVGQTAEKFVRGEFKIAKTVLAKNEKMIRRVAPNLGAKSVEKVSIYLARAEAAGIEITSDTLQTLLQQYCMYGEIREQEFLAGILMSAGGNVIGHSVAIKNDVKIKAKQAEVPKLSGDALTSSQAKTESLLYKLEQQYKDTPYMEDISELKDIIGQVTDPNVRAYIDKFLQHIIDVPSSAEQGAFIKIRELTDAVNTFNGNYSVYINPNDIDGLSAMARFSKFVKDKGSSVDEVVVNPWSTIEEPLSLQQAETLKQDLAVENKLYGIRQYMKRNQRTPMADYIYDSYYLNYLKEKNVSLKVIEQLSDFNKKHGVKVMLPEQFNNADVPKVFKLMEKEFDEWKTQSGGTAKMPPIVDFSTAKTYWYDSSSAYGQGVAAAYHEDGNNSLAFGEFSEERVQDTIRHEMTHANDTKNGFYIPDKYNLDEIMPQNIIGYDKQGAIITAPDIERCQYVDEFRKIGIPEWHIPYAYNNTKEFIAVASEGDLSKCSPEFKQMLIDFGMPEYRFNFGNKPVASNPKVSTPSPAAQGAQTVPAGRPTVHANVGYNTRTTGSSPSGSLGFNEFIAEGKKLMPEYNKAADELLYAIADVGALGKTYEDRLQKFSEILEKAKTNGQIDDAVLQDAKKLMQGLKDRGKSSFGRNNLFVGVEDTFPEFMDKLLSIKDVNTRFDYTNIVNGLVKNDDVSFADIKRMVDAASDSAGGTGFNTKLAYKLKNFLEMDKGFYVARADMGGQSSLSNLMKFARRGSGFDPARLELGILYYKLKPDTPDINAGLMTNGKIDLSKLTPHQKMALRDLMAYDLGSDVAKNLKTVEDQVMAYCIRNNLKVSGDETLGLVRLLNTDEYSGTVDTKLRQLLSDYNNTAVGGRRGLDIPDELITPDRARQICNDEKLIQLVTNDNGQVNLAGLNVAVKLKEIGLDNGDIERVFTQCRDYKKISEAVDDIMSKIDDYGLEVKNGDIFIEIDWDKISTQEIVALRDKFGFDLFRLLQDRAVRTEYLLNLYVYGKGKNIDFFMDEDFLENMNRAFGLRALTNNWRGSTDSNDKIAEVVMQSMKNQPTEAQREAINAYKGSDSNSINTRAYATAIRQGDLIDEYLSSTPLQQGIHVRRDDLSIKSLGIIKFSDGVSLEEALRHPDLYKDKLADVQSLVGQSYVNDRFISTTTDPNGVFSQMNSGMTRTDGGLDIVWSLDVEPGVGVCAIEGISPVNPEAEILLNRNCRFVIEDIKVEGTYVGIKAKVYKGDALISSTDADIRNAIRFDTRI